MSNINRVSLFHDEELSEGLLSEVVEEGCHVGHELKATVDGARDLLQDGLVGHLVEAFPSLHHVVHLDLLQH